MVDSISKTPVGSDVAAAIARDAFGHDAELADLSELTEGWFNAAYVLTLADGRRGVLKVAPPPDVQVMTYERDIMTTEVEAMRLVRRCTSLPVPEVLWFDTSCRRVASPLFVMEHCAGRMLSEVRPTLDTTARQGIDAQLAQYLSELAAITNPTFGLQAPGAPAFRRWSEAFGRLMSDLLDDGAARDVQLPVGADVIRHLVASSADELDEAAVPRFVHWDLWDTNVFVDPETLAVTGVIDFERALWGDPLMEGQFLARRDDETFMAAYGTRLHDGPGARRRRLLYDVYLYVVMVVEDRYRMYPTDDIVTFARAGLARTLAALGAA